MGVRQTPNVAIIPERSGIAFRLEKGATLTVIDPRGGQIAGLVAFSAADPTEVLSPEITRAHTRTLRLTKGHRLYSEHSLAMMTITSDSVGWHDFVPTACANGTPTGQCSIRWPRRNCSANLAVALKPHGIDPATIPTTFGCFTNLAVGAENYGATPIARASRAGDHIAFRADMSLIVGLATCSGSDASDGTFNPIHYRIDC
jgi:uncharacterized protein